MQVFPFQIYPSHMIMGAIMGAVLIFYSTQNRKFLNDTAALESHIQTRRMWIKRHDLFNITSEYLLGKPVSPGVLHEFGIGFTHLIKV